MKMVFLTIVMMVSLAEAKLATHTTTTKIGIPVNLDKVDNLSGDLKVADPLLKALVMNLILF